MNSTREFVIGKLSTLLDITKDDKICTDLEKCILNHSHDRCRSQPAWDNPHFTSIYKHKFLSIQKCLINSEELKEKIHYDFLKDNNFIELKEADLMTSRIQLLNQVAIGMLQRWCCCNA